MEQGTLPEGFDFEMFQQQTAEEASTELRVEEDYLQQAAIIRERFTDLISRYGARGNNGGRHRIVAYEMPSYDSRRMEGAIEMRSLVMVSHVGSGCVMSGFGMIPHQRLLAKEYVRTNEGQLLVMQDFYLHGDGRASYGEDYVWVNPGVKANSLRLPFFSFAEDDVQFTKSLDTFPPHFVDMIEACGSERTVFSDSQSIQTMQQALKMGDRMLTEVSGFEPRLVR